MEPNNPNTDPALPARLWSTEHGWRAQSLPIDSSAMTVVQSSDGSPLFIAAEVGVALGYGDDGRRLRDSVQGEWADRMRPCDVMKLTGDDLAALKAVGAVGPNAPSLVLLTESGLYRVLMLSGKPAALRLQEWLADEVLPALRRTGMYGTRPPASDQLGAMSRAAADAGDFRRALQFMKLHLSELHREQKERRREAKRAKERKALEPPDNVITSEEFHAKMEHRAKKRRKP